MVKEERKKFCAFETLTPESYLQLSPPAENRSFDRGANTHSLAMDIRNGRHVGGVAEADLMAQ